MSTTRLRGDVSPLQPVPQAPPPATPRAGAVNA